MSNFVERPLSSAAWIGDEAPLRRSLWTTEQASSTPIRALLLRTNVGRGDEGGYSAATSINESNRSTIAVAPICSKMSRASLATVASA